MISVYKHKTSTKNIFVAIQRKHLPAASESSKLNAKGMTEVEFTRKPQIWAWDNDSND